MVPQIIEAGRQLTIRVTDDGAGIGSADLPRVVDRFYPADRSRSRRTGAQAWGWPLPVQLSLCGRSPNRWSSTERRPG